MALTKPKLSQNIDTDISVFSDPILVLHQGSTSANLDVGFLMNRSNGLTSNAAVIWQESSKSFVHILTNSSGVADSNLVVQSYANVSVGNVLLINNAGIYVDGTLGTAGQVLASDGAKTYWAPPGGFTGGTVPNPSVFQSNLVLSSGTDSVSDTTGALVVIGGIGASANVYANRLYTTQGLYWAGNGQVFTSTTLANTEEITANLSSGQNVGLSLTTTGVAAGNYGSATSIPTIVVDSKGRITSVTSNVVSTTITLAGQSGSGSVAGGGTLTVNGTSDQLTTSVSSSTITIAFAQDIITPGNVTVLGNLVVQGNTTTLNTETLTVEDLNITVANGAATAAAADGAGLTVAGANARLLYKSATDAWVFDKGVFASGNLVANSGTASTNTTTGALVVAGGAGISGSVYLDSMYTASGIFWSGNSVPFTANTANYVYITESTDDNITYDIPYISPSSVGDTYKQLYSDATGITFNPSTNVFTVSTVSATTITGSGVLSTSSNTQATSTTTGALRITGGASINTGNLYIGGSAGRSITAAGNMVVTGTSSTSTTTGAIVVSGGIGVSGAIYAGLVTASTTLTAGTTLVVGTTSALAGIVTASSATTSTSITTGAVVLSGVAGGLGLQGNVFAGGNVYVRSRVGYTYSGNATSAVYQQYNAATNSLDTVFG